MGILFSHQILAVLGILVAKDLAGSNLVGSAGTVTNVGLATYRDVKEDLLSPAKMSATNSRKSEAKRARNYSFISSCCTVHMRFACLYGPGEASGRAAHVAHK